MGWTTCQPSSPRSSTARPSGQLTSTRVTASRSKSRTRFSRRSSKTLAKEFTFSLGTDVDARFGGRRNVRIRSHGRLAADPQRVFSAGRIEANLTRCRVETVDGRILGVRDGRLSDHLRQRRGHGVEGVDVRGKVQRLDDPPATVAALRPHRDAVRRSQRDGLHRLCFEADEEPLLGLLGLAPALLTPDFVEIDEGGQGRRHQKQDPGRLRIHDSSRTGCLATPPPGEHPQNGERFGQYEE